LQNSIEVICIDPDPDSYVKKWTEPLVFAIFNLETARQAFYYVITSRPTY